MGAVHRVVVAADDNPLFGRTYRPLCTQIDCYRGPFVPSKQRAAAIGDEHTRKATGRWRSA